MLGNVDNEARKGALEQEIRNGGWINKRLSETEHHLVGNFVGMMMMNDCILFGLAIGPFRLGKNR